MPWPIPTPAEIADRAAGTYEAEYARVWSLLKPGEPPAQVDARSPTSLLAIDARVLAMTSYDVWAYLARLAQELMADTATDWLPQHAALWGVPRVQAVAATGNVVLTGVPGTPVPSGLALSAPSGSAYATTAAATIGAGNTATVPVAAAVAGAAGNLPAGTVLTVATPLSGLTTQTAVVDASGLTGQDAETVENWRARILERVRKRGAAGNADDFHAWTKEVFPTAIVRAMSPAVGEITVAFALPSGETWRVPTSPEVTTLSTYLNDATVRKPLGAPVVLVVGATLQPVNLTLAINPDTTATRAAALDALAEQMRADATIGGTVYLSRLDAALQNASGQFSHTRAAPTADVTAAATTLSVLGTVTFT